MRRCVECDAPIGALHQPDCPYEGGLVTAEYCRPQPGGTAMNIGTLTQLETAAQEQNGWCLLGAVETDPGGDGTVPNGIALIERASSPFGDGREYGTARWYIQPEGAGFESGNYDLTREDALADFADRVRR